MLILELYSSKGWQSEGPNGIFLVGLALRYSTLYLTVAQLHAVK